MAKGTVTITSIAEKLNISPSTVSCVLRGDAKKFRIAKSTSKKILNTAEKLGYVPNQNARNLRAQKSNCISVLFSDLELSWADTVLKGVESVINAEHHGIFIAVDRRSSELFKREAESILQRRDEAVICHSHNVVLESVERLRNSIPLVFVSDLAESLVEIDGLNTVLWDGSAGIRKAIEHFAGSGRRKVAFIGCRHGFVSDMRRYNAYKEALDYVGLEHNENFDLWVSGDFVTADMPIIKLFANKEDCPDAIFALNDSIAIKVMRSLKKNGLRVPEDVAVIGVGDLPMSEFIGLTTIVEPLEELGKQAANMVLKLINENKKGQLQYEVCDAELVIRDTA